VEAWLALVLSGDAVGAWDQFLSQYRRLILATIRRSSADPDTVMDVFAYVCEALQANGFARLRKYRSDNSTRARFTTWLVIVIQRLTIDWFRRRDGRRQAVPPASLTPRQQDIYRLVFLEQHRHREAYELLRQRRDPALLHREFGEDLRVAQRAYNQSSHRGRPQAVGLTEALTDPAGDTEQRLHTGEARRHLDEALASLPAPERLAVLLFVVHQMPAAQVARLVGWPDAKSVYNRVYRLLKTLHDELNRRGISAEDL
jgi:RNA polymerase sigma factor (sigma-70 family)